MTANMNGIRGIIFAALLAFVLSGCGRCQAPEKKDVIGYVNKEPILESELMRDLAIRARQNPAFKLTPETKEEELNNLINRKLLIQAATAKRLEREIRFVSSIKNFWEQTLIRDLIDYKRREFQGRITVTEDEIKNYYDNMIGRDTLGSLEKLRPEIAKRIAAEKEARLFEEWLKEERAKARVRVIKK